MTTSTIPSTLAEWLARCEHAHPIDIDMTLDRARQVKTRLGIEFRVPVVVVAGTNGKGSTCAMLDSIGRQAGWRVGLYSKPHLVHFEERCRIDGVMIDGQRLIPHFEAVERARGDITLTYFEHTTLAIMRLLSQAELDLAILEVGLGGRLDAVNVIDASCAVITGVDIDHTEYLGPDREAIGREKAGILRAGRPAVVGDAAPPASLLAHAQALGTPLKLAGRDFHIERGVTDQWSWRGWGSHRKDLPLPALLGEVQLQNASTALAALELLPLPRPDDVHVAEGLRRVLLPGRFQVLSKAPDVIVDVAHNRQSVRALSATLCAMPHRGRTFAVFGCMRDKDAPMLIEEFGTLVTHWFVTDLPAARAASSTELLWAVIERGGGAGVTAFSRVTEALEAALQAAMPLDRVVVFGSFFTVAEAVAGGRD